MAGQVTGDSIIIPDKMLAGMGVEVVIDEVTRLDTENKLVHTTNNVSFPYDKLFLAMGSESHSPPIKGKDLNGVLTLRGLQDATRIKDTIINKGVRDIIFIGGGFISLEIASLLQQISEASYRITIVELMNRPLPLMLDTDMGGEVKSYLEEQGLTLFVGEKVEKILGNNGSVVGVELESGMKLDADLVLLNVGVKPNTTLAEAIGLQIGRFGIKVNEYQETSHPDILAGGDCVEKFNFITKKPTSGQLRGPAVVQGRLAAKRLAGFDIKFPGVLDAGGCKLFDMTVTATGFTEERAREEGFETVSAVVDSRSKHNMIPGMKPWKIKLVFDRSTEKLLGGQILSQAVAPAREIDAISALIWGEKTISDLTTFTSACNPDISSEPSAEPITIAAEQALQKLKS